MATIQLGVALSLLLCWIAPPQAQGQSIPSRHLLQGSLPPPPPSPPLPPFPPLPPGFVYRIRISLNLSASTSPSKCTSIGATEKETIRSALSALVLRAWLQSSLSAVYPLQDSAVVIGAVTTACGSATPPARRRGLLLSGPDTFSSTMQASMSLGITQQMAEDNLPSWRNAIEAELTSGTFASTWEVTSASSTVTGTGAALLINPSYQALKTASPPAPPPDFVPPPPPESTLSVAMIAGIAGGAAYVAVIAGILVFVFRQRWSNPLQPAPNRAPVGWELSSSVGPRAPNPDPEAHPGPPEPDRPPSRVAWRDSRIFPA